MSDGARVVAVDWSGAAAGAERKIWLAEVAGGAVTRLESGRSREATRDVLCAMVRAARAARDAGVALTIGLDFAFSLPGWFLDARGLASAPALWAAAGAEGARWLACAVPPFWGRGGVRRPDGIEPYRATEREVAAATGLRPSSAFKLVGPDQVGAASVRGMPVLAALRAAGARVWPFDDVAPGVPTVCEIWPRAAYAEPVVKSRVEARGAYLTRHAPALDAAFRQAAERSDDAFDAASAALAMWTHRDALAALPPARDARERREGRIWWPGLPRDDGAAAEATT